jgi:hypothetical protein
MADRSKKIVQNELRFDSDDVFPLLYSLGMLFEELDIRKKNNVNYCYTRALIFGSLYTTPLQGNSFLASLYYSYQNEGILDRLFGKKAVWKKRSFNSYSSVSFIHIHWEDHSNNYIYFQEVLYKLF